MQQFFYKLIPPRPDFHLDQNENEQSIMQTHAEYWTKLTAEKMAVVFGPVFHVGGVFGIAIIEVETEQDAIDIANNDPAVVSGISTYELIPMQIALIRN